MMEWWQVDANSCLEDGQPAETSVQFVADSALEQQVPSLLQQHQHQHQQQEDEQNQSAGQFDPWLACDDLELGTIIQQVSSAVVSSPSCSDVSMSQIPLVSTGVEQEKPYGDSKMGAQSRRGSDSKQHIINIINNSLPHTYQQQQQRNNSMTTGSSIAASPHSSSLGSSPLNSLSSNYSSLSPHSSPSSSYNQPTAQHHQRHHPQIQQHHHHANQIYRFGTNDDFHLHQQQHAQAFNGSTSRLANQTPASNIVTSTNGAIDSTPAGAKMSAGAIRYNQSKTPVQSAGLGASLLLTHAKPQTRTPTKQARQTSNAILEAPSLATQAQKQRRCRHITDFVLAEEEKRLLIKEGHTDFPMDCQLRPLTKMEERILRKIRRKIRNKKSAQCSRQRKKEYVEELERKYAETVRENIELKQLLAKIHSSSENNQEHEFQVDLVTKNQMQSISDDCAEVQTSCESDSVEMHWKDLFQSESVADRTSRMHLPQPQHAGALATYD